MTPVNRYLYDPEGRICAVQGAPVAGVTPMMGYLYDAEGNRIAKGTITTWGSCDPAANGFQLTETYVLDQSGEESSQLSTQNGTTTWERSNVYGAGRLLATYDAAGLHFHLSDPLGTRRGTDGLERCGGNRMPEPALRRSVQLLSG